MTARRHFLHLYQVAIAATWWALLATTGMAEGSMAGGRRCDSAPALAACCAGRPETCNRGCCPPAAVISRIATDEAAAPAWLSTARPACIPAACQCRSSEPVAPGSTPDRRTTDDRSDYGEGVSLAWLGHVLSPAPAYPVALNAGNRLKSPLYVLTTHLRF